VKISQIALHIWEIYLLHKNIFHAMCLKTTNLYKQGTEFLRTLVRVSVKMASISDRIAVFISGIICAFFSKCYLSTNPPENKRKCLSPVRLTAMELFTWIAQNTVSQDCLLKTSSRKRSTALLV
jgi:hypothetical protein